MAGINLNMKLLNAEKLLKTLKSSDTIAKPITDGILKIALYYEGLVKKATVVDTGRLRSSVTHQVNGASAIIGTNVIYAEAVEYGKGKVRARHMEGGAKVLGKGMFTYALGLLQKWLDKGSHGIHKAIETRFD